MLQRVASLQLVMERIYIEVLQVLQEVLQMESDVKLVISTYYVKLLQVLQNIYTEGYF